MQKQMTFSDVEYGERRRVSRREIFLDMMDGIVPWQILTGLIEPWYFPGARGRPPMGIEVMLRMYFLSIWYNLVDEALEEAIYDSYAMRKFMRLNFLEGNVPGAATLLRFRHLLEEHGLQAKILEAELLRKDDGVAYGDNGYQGLENRPEVREDGHLSGVECRINRKKGAGRKREKEACGDPVNHLEYIGEPNWDHVIEGQKSKVRSKAGHMFGIVKGLFGFHKVRYRGLKKNLAKLQMLFAGANLLKYAWAGCPDWKPAV